MICYLNLPEFVWCLGLIYVLNSLKQNICHFHRDYELLFLLLDCFFIYLKVFYIFLGQALAVPLGAVDVFLILVNIELQLSDHIKLHYFPPYFNGNGYEVQFILLIFLDCLSSLIAIMEHLGFYLNFIIRFHFEFQEYFLVISVNLIMKQACFQLSGHS